MNASETITGRNLVEVITRLRDEIVFHRYREGGYLPSTRELSDRFDVSAETVRRGLKQLESEGLLESKPRSGFRVLASQQTVTDRPFAFITDYRSDLSNAQPATQALSLEFQAAAARKNCSMLSAHAGGRPAEELMAQIKGGNARGVILDTIDTGLRTGVVEAGLPVVMVNSWVEDIAVDVVLQDNYRGGFLATEHLLELGARRIVWVGATLEYCHSRERFAGANAALSKRGLFMTPEDCIPDTDEAGRRRLQQMLTGANRPEGFLAFGPDKAKDVSDLAAANGLLLGRDLNLVSWVVEERYENDFRARFAGSTVPPAIVWSAREMVERALALLDERNAGVNRRAVRACVATELKHF